MFCHTQSNEVKERVTAMVRYFKFCDVETDVAIATREENCSDPLPLRFFKNSREAEAAIQEQLSHVVKGCLSDPEGVAMHHQNPKTGQHYTRRGTNSLESDHRGLDLLTGNHIGVGLCDRKASTYFELLNEKKQVNRLGGHDYGTHRTETLAFTNSLAASAGHSNEKLPFPNLSVPALPEMNQREHFGFHSVSDMTNQEFWRRHHESQPGLSNATDGEDATDPNERAPSLNEVLQGLDAAEAAEDGTSTTEKEPEEQEDDPAIEAAVARITPLM